MKRPQHGPEHSADPLFPFSSKPSVMVEERCCEWPGCDQEGGYPAPKSKHYPESFLRKTKMKPAQSDSRRTWFCLEHVRVYNQSWNFFDGMNAAQLNAFERDAMTGHRQTEKVNHLGAKYVRQMEQAYRQAGRFQFGDDFAGQKAPPPKTQDTKQKEALEILGLTLPLDRAVLKKTYRSLVKQCHPDLFQTKEAEEQFKRISIAYRTLQAGLFA